MNNKSSQKSLFRLESSDRGRGGLTRAREIGLKLSKGSSASPSKHRLTVIVNGGEEALRMTAGEEKTSLRLFVRQWLVN